VGVPVLFSKNPEISNQKAFPSLSKTIYYQPRALKLPFLLKKVSHKGPSLPFWDLPTLAALFNKADSLVITFKATPRVLVASNGPDIFSLEHKASRTQHATAQQ